MRILGILISLGYLVLVCSYSSADTILEDFEAGVVDWAFRTWGGGGDTTGSTLSPVSTPVVEGGYSGELYYKFNTTKNDVVQIFKLLPQPLDVTGMPFLSISIYGDSSNHTYMIEYSDFDTGAYSYNGSFFGYGANWSNTLSWTGWRKLIVPLPTYRFDRLDFYVNDKADSFTGDGRIYLDDIKFVPSPLVLNAGWNHVGGGGNTHKALENCSIYNGDTNEIKSFTDAASAGLIHGTIYYFDTATQSFKQTPGDDNNVQWYRSYWVYSYTDNLSLRVPLPI
jgi:hypothetical protein